MNSKLRVETTVPGTALGITGAGSARISQASRRRQAKRGVASLLALGLMALANAPLTASAGSNPAVDMVPLSQLPVPKPSNSDIADEAAAVRLGKALFWDTQAGGDGQTACASCHFNAGVDNRTLNTINPGPNAAFDVVAGSGQSFTGVTFSADDIVGSQGVAAADFNGVTADPSIAADNCTANPHTLFNGDRQVTGRNAPSIIGAVFYRDNFWDGRANHQFNGRDPFGATGNAGAPIGSFMENSSLASQAVGPANNPVEMSCNGRTFNGANSLGAKLLARQPLQFQQVSPTDSVLGSLAAPGNGLTVSYQQMIDAAFGPASVLASAAADNFSRIWGQAIQAYETSLIPDQAPIDRYLAGDKNALSARQVAGLGVFTGKGGCATCHAGPLMSDATVAFAASKGLVNEDGGDVGFHNTGVRPTADNPGRAGSGPNGVSFEEISSTFNLGAFKTPHLRNLKLTAPYFHDGDKASLADVVDFYNRGGDFANPEKAKRIKPLSLSASDKAALVDFMTNATTDCRVEKEQAPFDHPSLPLPNAKSGGGLAAVGAAGTGVCP